MKTVFVNGTFDIVHSAHLELLNYAKSLGDKLYVAIDADERVKELKGPTRPINSQEERRKLLENLKAVDGVCVFYTTEELIQLVKGLDVDIIVKGSDHRGNYVEGQEYVKEVVWFERIDGYSSTAKIQSIVDRR